MSVWFKWIFIAGCVFSNQALAVDLYSGEVIVSSQEARERLASIPDALIQVLQKHSGQRELPLHPALDSALASAGRITVSFHYREHERLLPDGTASMEWRLVVNFLPEEVDRIVRELELPRWPQERKTIVIWIVVDDGLGRRLMPVEYSYAWNALSDIASRRGLPISWPELSDEQLQDIDLQLLWGGFTDELQTGEASDVVIVAARREGPVWNVRWNFGGGDETAGWRVRDTDLAFALVDGLHVLTDTVVARDAIAPGGQGYWQTPLRVTGFRGADDYARCLSYLEGLSVVDRVSVSEAGPGTVRFVLELNALPRYLEDELERDGFLVAGQLENEYWFAHAVIQVPAAPGEPVRDAR